jgi:ABC-type uncharacterized transport system substrate-binding protein
MRKINFTIITFLILLIGTLVLTNIPEKTLEESIVEIEANHYKDRQKLGLVISGEDQEFAGTFHYMLEELQDQELISGYQYSYHEGRATCKEIWQYASENVVSDYLHFDQDSFYDIELEGVDAFDSVLGDSNMDLLLTLGTKAGQLTINPSNKIDTFNILAEDAVQSGITDYKAYSDQENLWVLIDNNKHLKKLNIFHSLVGFEKLGVIRYPDSFRRSFTPEATLEKFAQDRGIEVIYYDIEHIDEMFAKGQIELYYEQVRQAHITLAQECDAFYMIVGGWNPKDILDLLQPFYDRNIPVVSAVGQVDVVNGALLGVGKSDFEEIGDLTANNIIKILKGTRPNELMQIYDEKQAISYNVNIGKAIDFTPDIEFLLYCDEFVSGAYEE